MAAHRTYVARGTLGPVAARFIVEGSWTCRWADWVVHLRGSDVWCVTVWRWTVGGRLEERQQIGYQEGLATAEDAAKWACDVLRASGAKVFVIDKPTMQLESFLRFHPAPRDTP